MNQVPVGAPATKCKRPRSTIETEKVKALIEAGLPGAKVEVTGDGRHFEAVVVSSALEGKSLIRLHRMVKDMVKAQIESDELHALSIKTRLP